MTITVQVSQLGVAFLPDKFADAATSRIKMFAVDQDRISQTRRYLKNGGSVVLAGPWSCVWETANQLLEREHELLPRICDPRKRKSVGLPLRQRILTLLEYALPSLDGWLDGVMPGLLGEDKLPPLPVLVPVQEVVALSDLAFSSCSVPSISFDLLVHPDVLVPRSQPTVQLLCDAISQVASQLPLEADVLDMGCGSGVMTIASAQGLAHLSPRITAADILPEALATTRLNVRRLAERGKIDASHINISRSGDLFQPLGEQVYDLIIFNAPWVTAPARTRAELALNDADQRTIQRFLRDCPRYLRPGGRVIVGYADNSGAQAIVGLEERIEEAGLWVTAVIKDRIKTHRSQRAWQSIYAYILAVK